MDPGRVAPVASRRGSTILQRVARIPVAHAVLGITVFALVLRMVFLGARPAHFDEGRISYISLRMARTDTHVYRHIVHGPLLQHVTAVLFDIFGPSDILARIPVAIVGGLFPLSALLYREHLREAETVVLSLLLALSPPLLYYSRFMRSDILVAAFMFTTFGMLLRLYDTRRLRYLYAASFFLALGIASKENAALYVLSWLGAVALLLAGALFGLWRAGDGFERIWQRLAALREALPSARSAAHHGGHLAAAVLLLAAIWLFLFATRGDAAAYHPVTQAEIPAVTLGEAVASPGRFPALVESTGRYWVWEYFSWAGTSSPDSGDWVSKYEHFAPKYFDVLLTYAAPTMVLSAVGLLRERFVVAEGRNLVLLFGYAGFASALAYPFALDIFGPWNVIHAVVPLAIPAAVGIAACYRRTRSGLDTDHVPTIVIGLLLLVVIVGQVGVTATTAVYQDPTSKDNDLVQFAQPQPEFRTALTAVDLQRIAAQNDGADVLVYGDSFVKRGDSNSLYPACMGGWSGWSSALPIPWYLYAADAEVDCVRIISSYEESFPPVIVTKSERTGVAKQYVPNYEVQEGLIRTHGTTVAFLVDPNATAR